MKRDDRSLEGWANIIERSANQARANKTPEADELPASFCADCGEYPFSSVVNDAELIEVARKAIENVLVEWRDMRLSTIEAGNGLCIRERDGKPSSQIRITTAEAFAIGLKAIDRHLRGES